VPAKGGFQSGFPANDERCDLLGTGNASLDVLLGGGIPIRNAVIVAGDPGTGKTVLCSQIAFANAARGGKTVLATVTSEPHDKLVHALRAFAFFDAGRIGEDIYLLSAYPWLLKGPREARDGLLKAVRERKAQLLFIDGLRAVRDLWQDESKVRSFLYELNVGLAQVGAVGLFTTEYPLHRLLELPEATTVDGIVSLAMRAQGEGVVRRAQVVKLRGRPHLTGQHVMRIDSRGVEITPRLEAVTRPNADFEPSSERVGFGLPELDRLLGGGVYRQTTTIIAGGTGVGKTLLSLYFAESGARAGEPSLFVSLSEPTKVLVQRARRVGLDLAGQLESGRLTLDFCPAIEAEADHLAEYLLRRVEQLGARRLVLDGLSLLEDTLSRHGERTRPFLMALTARLREAGVTTVFVKQVPKVAGPELDFSDSAISILAENVLLLRHLELRGRLRRTLSALKMHDSDYDQNLREFELGSTGLRVLDPIASIERLHTGAAAPARADGHDGRAE
jgi:circadian clock protein KaiC